MIEWVKTTSTENEGPWGFGYQTCRDTSFLWSLGKNITLELPLHDLVIGYEALLRVSFHKVNQIVCAYKPSFIIGIKITLYDKWKCMALHQLTCHWVSYVSDGAFNSTKSGNKEVTIFLLQGKCLLYHDWPTCLRFKEKKSRTTYCVLRKWGNARSSMYKVACCKFLLKWVPYFWIIWREIVNILILKFHCSHSYLLSHFTETLAFFDYWGCILHFVPNEMYGRPLANYRHWVSYASYRAFNYTKSGNKEISIFLSRGKWLLYHDWRRCR